MRGPLRDQTHRELVNRPFQFQKRGQLFIGVHTFRSHARQQSRSFAPHDQRPIRSPNSNRTRRLSERPGVGDLYLEGHRIVPPGVLDDKLVLPILRRRDFHRAFRARRVVLADFLAGLVVDVQVHVGVLRAVRGGLELLPCREGQKVSDLALVLHLNLLALELRPLAQVGWLNVLVRGTQSGEREHSRRGDD